MTSKRLKGIGFVERYELCKSRMLKIYTTNFKKYNDKNRAYASAKKSLRRCLTSWEITNKSQIFGLYAELNYYHNYFQDQELTSEMAIGYHSDFRGLIGGKSAAIDVTSNPSYKKKEDYAEITGNLHSGWDYYLGVADIPKEESIYHPFLLPICSDGEIGHFVLVLETTTPGSWNMYGELADREYIIKYNPKCGGDDEESVEEVVSISNYIITPPKLAISEIRNSFSDWLFEDPDNPELNMSLNKEIDEYFKWLVTDFRRETGVIISAIGQLDQMLEINDFDYITRQYWVHPHEFVRKDLGDVGTAMDYNIAGYLYDEY